MKISWGIKITVLYSCFVALIVTLVVSSMHQHFDLVAADYYTQEVAYQQTIDAGRNQSKLSDPIMIHADSTSVVITLPTELSNVSAKAAIQFYSPVNSVWDRKFNNNVSGNGIVIPRNKLLNTRYIIKINLTANGKKYYQESEIILRAS